MFCHLIVSSLSCCADPDACSQVERACATESRCFPKLVSLMRELHPSSKLLAEMCKARGFHFDERLVTTMQMKLGMLIASSIALLPVMACAETRNVVIFFTEWSAQVDQAAGTSINEAAELANQTGAGTVVVTGFAGNTGTAKAAALLSSTRAQVVVDRLVANGVSQRRIRVISNGATGFVQSEVESHKVTIAIPLR